MPKGCKGFLKVFVMASIIFFICLFLLVHWLMYRMPHGEFMTESISPNKTYTVRLYLCNGGATTGYSVRGELINNKFFKIRKNFYWEANINKDSINWIDDNTIIINGRRIDLPHGRYDCRRD